MKRLRQKTTGEIYVWTESLAKRKDMEEFTVEIKPVVQPTEVLNEEETSLGAAEPQEEKPEVKPKAKSQSKGKR